MVNLLCVVDGPSYGATQWWISFFIGLLLGSAVVNTMGLVVGLTLVDFQKLDVRDYKTVGMYDKLAVDDCILGLMLWYMHIVDGQWF